MNAAKRLWEEVRRRHPNQAVCVSPHYWQYGGGRLAVTWYLSVFDHCGQEVWQVDGKTPGEVRAKWLASFDASEE
jgi:hypothetical protein